ncbi:two-pore potassium channel 1-like [Mercurialis annua]|uniref:two-pore potassium channel 1-like n=1 Tax=Mercurialis annua TaxID=3986 RepID=UPI00215E80B9|nr:two-pore potassium channel 1-like [Mercurialis annua]XP_050216349.1 two-pore potassium channel 1-like [Mercurialis annua]
MASTGEKLHFLSKLVDQTNKVYNSSRRRLQTVKNSPLPDLIPKDLGKVSLEAPESISGKFHPTFPILAVAVAVYLVVGTLCFYVFINDVQGEKSNEMFDALYFTVVTMTTVGYGDLAPGAPHVKLFSCLFVAVGMILVGTITCKVADYIVEKQEKMLVKALSKQEKYDPFKIVKETATNKINYKCIGATAVLLIFMLVGVIYLNSSQNLRLVDAIYCVCTTIATVGYGDKAFSDVGGRLFGAVWILTGTFGTGQFFLYMTEEFVENRQKALVNWILTRGMVNLNTNKAEIAEFTVHKLKEMGKISQEDISCLMKEFEDLDVRQCGFLSASDLVFAQTKR